jgi:hypothetical protein
MDEEDDTMVVEEDHISTLTMVRWAKCHNFVPNYAHSVGISIV